MGIPKLAANDDSTLHDHAQSYRRTRGGKRRYMTRLVTSRSTHERCIHGGSNQHNLITVPFEDNIPAITGNRPTDPVPSVLRSRDDVIHIQRSRDNNTRKQ